MALLRAKNVDASLTIAPFSSEGSTILEIVRDGKRLLSTTVFVTADDFADMCPRLREVAESVKQEIRCENLDADFIIEAERLVSPDDVSFRIWHGEPYMFMRGYRFVVASSHLAAANSRKRSVWSTAWRLTSRTRGPSLKASMRQPSYFSS